MRELVATVLISISTNWSEIGNFIPTTNSNVRFKVEVGRVVTNYDIWFTYQPNFTVEEEEYRFRFKKSLGPVIGERKTELPVCITNAYIQTPWSWLRPPVEMTNIIFGKIVGTNELR